MYIHKAPQLSAEQTHAVFQLWNQEYPAQLKYQEVSQLDNYLAPYSGLHYLLYTAEHEIQGWAFCFRRAEENWIAIILDHKVQGKGYGRTLLNEMKADFSILNGWVIDNNQNQKENGTPYLSPLEFYLKNGFTVFTEDRLETPQISAVKIQWTANPPLSQN